MFMNESLTKSFWKSILKPSQCPFPLCLKALIPFQPGSPKQYFPLGSSEPNLRGGRKCATTGASCTIYVQGQTAPLASRAIRSIRSIRSRQNWGVCCRNDGPASALPFGPWFDAWHGQHWPSVGVFGKSWSLVCSIWKINEAMHFDGRNVEQVTETYAPCSIHAIVSRLLFVFVDICWFPCSISYSSISSVQGMFEGQTCTSVQQVSLGKWLSNNFGGSQWNRKRNEWAKLLHLWLSLMHS